jgi:hypothetical protein
MLQNITFSADKDKIRRARKKANTENTTLNEVFRQWIDKYVERPETSEEFTALMAELAYVKPGRKFTRIELNER